MSGIVARLRPGETGKRAGHEASVLGMLSVAARGLDFGPDDHVKGAEANLCPCTRSSCCAVSSPCRWYCGAERGRRHKPDRSARLGLHAARGLVALPLAYFSYYLRWRRLKIAEVGSRSASPAPTDYHCTLGTVLRPSAVDRRVGGRFAIGFAAVLSDRPRPDLRPASPPHCFAVLSEFGPYGYPLCRFGNSAVVASEAPPTCAQRDCPSHLRRRQSRRGANPGTAPCKAPHTQHSLLLVRG